jgi:hypothetical protein
VVAGARVVADLGDVALWSMSFDHDQVIAADFNLAST